jgi:peptide-methionine (S)-S-oxide reductase
MEIATFAGGCFWCTEAIFKRLRGVEKVESGYTGGNVENPSYDQVSMGNTNHAEAIQITFNPELISYAKLVKIFFSTHNPTTLNQQGEDVGTQYRSAIFYTDEKQKIAAEKEGGEFNKSNHYGKNATTSIEPLTKFYRAEENHQNYYERNKDNSYCTIVIDPKIRKLIKKYSSDLKEDYKE